MKKIALFLIALLLPLVASAYDFKVDGIAYNNITPNGETNTYYAEVTYGDDYYRGTVVIPSQVTWNGRTYSVTTIGGYAFADCTQLEHVVIPNSVLYIGCNSFSGCTKLENITLPESLVKIFHTVWSNDRGAFQGCTSLKSVYLPASLARPGYLEVSIGTAAFMGCTSLKTVYIAGTETTIHTVCTFADCTSLQDFVSCIKQPENMEQRTFTNLPSTARLLVPDGTSSAYKQLEGWNMFKSVYERSSYSQFFAIVTAGLGGKVSWDGESVAVGTHVKGVAKGQSITFTVTPDEGKHLLRLLKDGQDVTSSVSNGKYTVSNIQKDFTLEAVFEEGSNPQGAGGTATLSIEPFSIKGGETQQMLIDVNNPDDDITSVEFYMQLPQGLSIAMENGEAAVDIAGRTTWKNHTLTVNTSDGHFMLYSSSNATLSGTSGAVISVKLQAASNFNGGDIRLTKQTLNTPVPVTSKPGDYTYTIKGDDTPPVGDFITFADPIVEALCLYYWDTNKDGGLTKQEAAAVTSLGDVFCLDPNKTKSWQDSNGSKDGLVHGNFTSFDELQYFTGLTAIDEGAFYSQQSLQSITLPASIKTIGKYAFYYCWNLKAINVPNSVETIGDGAFSSCKNAESLVLGRSVKTIGDAAFRGCGKLTEVTIHEGCTSIGGSAFYDCTKLTKLTLPASLKSVGSYMLAYVDNNVNIYLGSKDLWQQLNIVYLADDNEDEDGIVEQSDYRLYYNGQELTEVELPQTMTSIGNNFKNCQSIKSLTIPKTVTSMAVLAFNGCRNLTSVTSYIENPFYIEDAVFEYTNPNTHSDVFTSATLYVPKGTKAKYQSQYGWKNFKNIVEMGGDEPAAQLEVSFQMNAVDGVVYDEQFNVRVTAKNIGSDTFVGDLFAYYRKQNEDGSWSGRGGLSINQTIGPDKTGWAGYRMAPEGKQPGHYKYEYGYRTGSGQEVTVGEVEFDYLPDDRYVTIVSFDNYKMITYCNENDLDFSNVSGLKAYTAGGFNTATSEVMMMRVTDVPAQTGVLLVGDFPHAYRVPKNTSSTIYVNMLVGVLESHYVTRDTDDGYTNYVFKDGAKGLAFYLANQGIGSYVWDNEAYLQVPTQAAASRSVITLKFDDTNSITDMENNGQPFDVYSLSGLLMKRGVTSLDQLPSGIYIVNGRKVVKK